MNETATRPPGTPIQQFSIMLDNRSGTLASLVTLLESKGIFCLGISIHDCREATIVRMVVTDPELTLVLLMEHGIGVTTSELVVVELKHGPSDLSHCLETLYQAETNVNYLYPLFPCHHGFARIALHVEDPAFARGILNSAGLHALYQEELSR